MPIDNQPPKSVKVIEVIEVIAYRGNGEDTIFREVIQYWSKDGKLLAEKDEHN